MTETKKNKQQQIKADRTNLLLTECEKLKVTAKEFTDKSAFRLNKLGKIIDYYPKGNKCFWHESKTWGEVSNITNFIKFEYANRN